MQYEKLFTPGKIGKLEIRNRIVMPAMESALGNGLEATDRIIAYYEERAKGGCGLIITEITRVCNGSGVGHPTQLNATSVEMVGGLERLSSAVHRHGGKIFCQLHHPGREGKEMFGGEPIVGPSAIASKVNDEIPRELTKEEISDIITGFVTSAKLCQLAGIDGVELHGAHGYLIQQFMCEYSNQRTDEYGGAFEKRMAFVSEIVGMIKTMCGDDFPVTIRINGDDYFEGGMTLEDSVEIAKYLESIGVDAINVSAGGYAAPNASTEPISYPQGWKRHLAKTIKENVNIPVIACDVIRKPDFAEELLQVDKLDFVALGRAQLADPYFATKARNGLASHIRPCICCMYCVGEVGSARSIKCAVNPRTSFESVYLDMKKDCVGKKAVVVGGGPAGMQAAINLSQRGFKVSLYEATDKLGGDVYLASIPPNKDKMLWLCESMEKEVYRNDVKVYLNKKVDVAFVAKKKPDVVVVAIGGDPIKPKFEGVNLSHVYTVDDVLNKSFKVNSKKIVVVGSGLTGLETAEHLASMGNDVTIIEREYEVSPSSGGGIGSSVSPTVADSLEHLAKLNVKILLSTELVSICSDYTVKVNGEVSSLDADMVVLSLGVRSDKNVINSFLKEFGDNAIIVGDAKVQGRVAEAIHGAFEKIYYLDPLNLKYSNKDRYKYLDVNLGNNSGSNENEVKTKYSANSKLGLLLTNEETKAILVKHFGSELLEHKGLAMAIKMGMTVRGLLKVAKEIPVELVEACDEDLKKITS